MKKLFIIAVCNLMYFIHGAHITVPKINCTHYSTNKNLPTNTKNNPYRSLINTLSKPGIKFNVAILSSSLDQESQQQGSACSYALSDALKKENSAIVINNELMYSYFMHQRNRCNLNHWQFFNTQLGCFVALPNRLPDYKNLMSTKKMFSLHTEARNQLAADNRWASHFSSFFNRDSLTHSEINIIIAGHGNSRGSIANLPDQTMRKLLLQCNKLPIRIGAVVSCYACPERIRSLLGARTVKYPLLTSCVNTAPVLYNKYWFKFFDRINNISDQKTFAKKIILFNQAAGMLACQYQKVPGIINPHNDNCAIAADKKQIIIDNTIPEYHLTYEQQAIITSPLYRGSIIWNLNPQSSKFANKRPRPLIWATNKSHVYIQEMIFTGDLSFNLHHIFGSENYSNKKILIGSLHHTNSNQDFNIFENSIWQNVVVHFNTSINNQPWRMYYQKNGDIYTVCYHLGSIQHYKSTINEIKIYKDSIEDITGALAI